MKDDAQSAKDEKRILDVLSKGLSSEFHNPSRRGCPGSAILEGIATRKVTLFESEPWLDHLGSCSACFAEFTTIRQRLRTRRQITVGSILAILIVVFVLCYSWRSRFALVVDETTVLDLRDYSIQRGRQRPTDRSSLVLGKSTRHLILYLPMGSKDGQYDLVLLRESGDELLHTTGMAQLENHAMLLKANVNLSSLPRDSYIVGVSQNGIEAIRFPVRVR